MNPLSGVPGFAFRNLRGQGTRSLLTLIGVVIGISAIITLFALSAGLNAAVSEQFEQLGSNTLYIFPTGLLSGQSSGSLSKTLSPGLIDKFRAIPEVDKVLSMVYSRGVLEVGRESKQLFVLAGTPEELSDYLDTGLFELESGRAFTSADTFSVIVGRDVASDGFDSPIRVGSKIAIEGRKFKVVGIMAQPSTLAGDPATANNSVFIPSAGFARIFEEVDPIYLILKTFTAEDVGLAKTKVERLMEKEFGKDQKYFEASTSEQLQEQVDQLLGIVQLVLVGIASVSLLVGGIGIMNTMVMSVLERTSEIGLMKAVGAPNQLVLAIFLAEAGYIGLAGGVVGLLIGYGLAFLVEIIANASGFALNVEWDLFLILGGLFFSVLVGVVSGLIPAIRASRMDPVMALRANG